MGGFSIPVQSGLRETYHLLHYLLPQIARAIKTLKKIDHIYQKTKRIIYYFLQQDTGLSSDSC